MASLHGAQLLFVLISLCSIATLTMASSATLTYPTSSNSTSTTSKTNLADSSSTTSELGILVIGGSPYSRSVAFGAGVSQGGEVRPRRLSKGHLQQEWTPRPAGKGGSPPRPALWGGGGVPRPAPPRKNDQNHGEVAGQNKGLNLKFLQYDIMMLMIIMMVMLIVITIKVMNVE